MISAEGDSACALSSAGTVNCWGYNNYGQLGNNSTATSSTPVEVVGVGGTGVLSSITSISTNTFTTCAVSSAGNVYCWGWNSNGQLGNNTTLNSSTPVEVVGVGGTGLLSGITSVSVGYNTACATSLAGNVYCWGWNSYGQLGNNTSNDSSTPVKALGVGGVGFLSGINSTVTTYGNTCALTSTGNTYCWGSNVTGELGVNSNVASSNFPLEVTGVGGSGFLSGITSITGNGDTMCTVSSGANAYCWGYNYYGQLGNNTTVSASAPIEVLSASGSGFLANVTAMSVGANSACALLSSGNVYCWGSYVNLSPPTHNYLPEQIAVSGITSISDGSGSACALTNTGNVYCWGFNAFGTLGDGTTSDSVTPVEVSGLE